jgi:hypothetical protein
MLSSGYVIEVIIKFWWFEFSSFFEIWWILVIFFHETWRKRFMEKKFHGRSKFGENLPVKEMVTQSMRQNLRVSQNKSRLPGLRRGVRDPYA